MIIEKLMRQADFTDVEKSIADYLLQNGYEIVPVTKLILTGEYTIDHTGRQMPA